MNLSQKKLENAVKHKLTNGYLAMDSKNLILWGALTSLIISSNMITFNVGYSQAQSDCVHTKQLIESKYHSELHKSIPIHLR
jgi:hypothetical protein